MIGAIIVGYRSADVIDPCIRSLLASEGAWVRVVVADNASSDDTAAVVRAVAADEHVSFAEFSSEHLGEIAPEDLARVNLIRSSSNLGFAGGVNLGLRALSVDPAISLFWLVNPDGVATPGAAAAYLRAAREGTFGLMGGRTIFHEPPNRIQSDGGRVSRWTGVCRNVNAGLLPEEATPPDAATIDFISGANVVASRAFVERVGPLVEDYFLYYEEVDWAARRGRLPLRLCPEAVVLHHGGTTIGTGSPTRRPSPFANYFNYRNRMRFMKRFHPSGLPICYAYAAAKIATLALRGAWREAESIFRGLNGLPPPAAVRERLAPEDAVRAFGGGRHRIVNFHGIGVPHDGVDAQEAPYWLSEERFASVLDRLRARLLDGDDIRITFDDGNRSDLAIAAPALAARGLRASFFVLTGRLEDPRYLSADDVRTLVAAGHDVGLHGHSHRDLRRVDAQTFEAETAGARTILSGVLGRDVQALAIPFGAYDRRVVSQLRRQRFATIYTSDGGSTRDGEPLRARSTLRSDMSDSRIKDILAGREPAGTSIRRRVSTAVRRHVL